MMLSSRTSAIIRKRYRIASVCAVAAERLAKQRKSTWAIETEGALW
jgi:hypothetical protein